MLNFEFLVKDLFLHHILCITFGAKYYFDVTFAAEVLIVIISCWRSPKTIQAVHPHTKKKKKRNKKKRKMCPLWVAFKDVSSLDKFLIAV